MLLLSMLSIKTILALNKTYFNVTYYRKYGLKIALDEGLTKRMHGDSDLSLMNYEFIYKVCIIHGNISVKIINFVMRKSNLITAFFVRIRMQRKGKKRVRII